MSTVFPVLSEDALYGLPGGIVRTIMPHSEADPAALLIQFLCAFGNILGRSPHFMVEADKHHMNLFVVLVGDTGTGRKGTSWGQVKRIFTGLDDSWERDCVTGGLASGEGLLYHVRDPVCTGQSRDEGVSDKRLLTFEGEFALVLRVQGRDSNTLSQSIRNLWDSGDARSLVKNSPIRTTGAHVSIIGHITRHDLLVSLDSLDLVNGYVNRFLWCCVRRTKFLPRGGQLTEAEIVPLRKRLADALDFGRTVERMNLDEHAWLHWDSIYEKLETSRKGLLAKITQRASPYTLRLASLYALLDHSKVVRHVHLKAALALWRYAEDSARYIFAERTGDALADTILQAVEGNESGLTRTEIRDLFNRNVSAQRMEAALMYLRESGLAIDQVERSDHSKRPIERWFACKMLDKPDDIYDFIPAGENNVVNVVTPQDSETLSPA